MQHRNLRIAFVGGGSVGHIAPNIAVIDALYKKTKKEKIPLSVYYIGRRNTFERGIVEKENIHYYGIFTGKLRRYWDVRHLSDPFLIAIGFFQSLFILLYARPDMVFLKGGFVTVPVALACKLLFVPMMAHESDIEPGMANKLACKLGAYMALGFNTSLYPTSIQKKSFFSGNPIRPDITGKLLDRKQLSKKYNLDSKLPIVLFIGGSQGSAKMNSLLESILPKLTKKFVVIHSVGKNDYGHFEGLKKDLDSKYIQNYVVYPYIEHDLGSFLQNASLIVSRAGVGGITEIMYFKKPSIIIPISSNGGHQVTNANYLAKNKIASVLDENVADGTMLYREIEFVISNRGLKDRITKVAPTLFPSNSAQIISDEIIRYLGYSN
ncbi:MAG: UDP-N-acetylglucosamine--N-acetylmuramyl-(pentapeptide) pyrophosphoryl-undecaprenol N-acetylglucosamine transferase [Patescibacteria group bacterium]